MAPSRSRSARVLGGERMKRAGHTDMPPSSMLRSIWLPSWQGLLLACSCCTFERDAEKGLCNIRSLVQAEIKSLRTCG